MLRRKPHCRSKVSAGLLMLLAAASACEQQQDDVGAAMPGPRLARSHAAESVARRWSLAEATQFRLAMRSGRERYQMELPIVDGSLVWPASRPGGTLTLRTEGARLRDKRSDSTSAAFDPPLDGYGQLRIESISWEKDDPSSDRNSRWHRATLRGQLTLNRHKGEVTLPLRARTTRSNSETRLELRSRRGAALDLHRFGLYRLATTQAGEAVGETSVVARRAKLEFHLIWTIARQDESNSASAR